MEKLFNGSLLRIEQYGCQVVVVEYVLSVSMVGAEVVDCLVPEWGISLHWSQGGHCYCYSTCTYLSRCYSCCINTNINSSRNKKLHTYYLVNYNYVLLHQSVCMLSFKHDWLGYRCDRRQRGHHRRSWKARRSPVLSRRWRLQPWCTWWSALPPPSCSGSDRVRDRG